MANKKLLIIAGVGIGGILLYELWKKKQAASGASTTDDSGAQYLLPPGLTTLPATGTSQANAGGNTSSIPSQEVQVVQQWATADGRAPVLAMANAMIQSEYDGMYDIITNFWDKGLSPGDAQTQFWNALRKKYDPSHKTW